MNKCRSISLATGLTLLALACVAQEYEGPDVYTYASYFYCAAASLTRADEIIASDAGRMNQLVDDGTISGWGWSSHVVGGQFRKLQTMTAVDHKSLLKARGEAIDAIYGEKNEAGAELSDICGPHVDYMWNIIHEK